MRESLEELKAIVENAPDDGMADEFFIYQGAANYIDNHENGHQFKIWCEDEQAWVFSELVDGWQYIRGRRSLSDVNRIIELMELNKNMHATVAGYLSGDDWSHWNEFNAGEFKL